MQVIVAGLAAIHAKIGRVPVESIRALSRTISTYSGVSSQGRAVHFTATAGSRALPGAVRVSHQRVTRALIRQNTIASMIPAIPSIA